MENLTKAVADVAGEGWAIILIQRNQDEIQTLGYNLTPEGMKEIIKLVADEGLEQLNDNADANIQGDTGSTQETNQ